MSIGTFCLIKNEAPWIAAHLLRIIDHIDEIVLFDGNSTDGTLEIIEDIQKDNKHGGKIKLFKNKDPENLNDAYTLLFNECLHAISTDFAFFIHPDMFVVNPDQILLIKDSPAIALSTSMQAYGGEPGGKLYEIKGRGKAWKNIYRLRNPDLGLHYHGHYGAANEDCYFSAITGDAHVFHGEDFDKYPYLVPHSGIEIMHYSDVRPYARRLSRMRTCLKNQGYADADTDQIASEHPRVTLKDGYGLTFHPAEYPQEFLDSQSKYSKYSKELSLV